MTVIGEREKKSSFFVVLVVINKKIEVSTNGVCTIKKTIEKKRGVFECEK